MKRLLYLLFLIFLTNCSTIKESNNIRVMENSDVISYIPNVEVISRSGDYTMVLYNKNDSIQYIKSDLIVIETIQLKTTKLPFGRTKVQYFCTEIPGYRTWKYKKIISN